MKLKCPNKKCLYEWEYNGEHKFYATCPRCLRKVKLHSNNDSIPTKKVDEEGKIK